MINEIFEITETVTQKYGGEILKFLGDGCLVTFSEEPTVRNSVALEADMLNLDESLLDENSGDCGTMEGGFLCQKARQAALEFQDLLGVLRKERIVRGKPGPQVGVGLHYGDCSYGNVGGPTRLDFTVIGPAVNLASRVEGLCKGLEASVLATGDFAKRDANSCWNYRGDHSVKGVQDAVSVYEHPLTMTKVSVERFAHQQ